MNEIKDEIKVEQKVEQAVEVKEAVKKEYNMELVKDLDNIFILGRGQSLGLCPEKKPENTEVWGCNNTYKAREVDRLFIMRDVYITQYNRETKIIEDANQKGFPVYTLGKYNDLKNNIQYPMQEAINEFGTGFFLTNISYMLALAIMQKPKNLILYGVDMSFNTETEYMRNEKGCIEFWLGIAIGRDIKIKLTKSSALMRRKNRNNFYGMIVKVDETFKTLHLEPDYQWGNRTNKSALKYKIVKFAHNL